MVADYGDVAEIECPIGGDFAAQVFWTDEYGDPVPVTEPILLDVKDANGQIAMRFSTDGDPASAPTISYASSAGFFQLTAPNSVTATLVPGRYVFDLFAAVADSASPFQRQVQQVVGGVLSALPRITKLEAAPVAIALT